MTGGLADDLQIPHDGINRHPVYSKGVERVRGGVVEDPVDGVRDVLQAQVGSVGGTRGLAQSLCVQSTAHTWRGSQQRGDFSHSSMVYKYYW
jgi:hypothetical protein